MRLNDAMQTHRSQRERFASQQVEFPPESGVKASVHDGFELIELHWRLLHSDLQRFRSAVGGAVALLIVAAAIAIASVPVALQGVAYLLARFTALDQAAALLICGAVTSAIAVVAGWWSSRAIARSFAMFDASLQEGRRTIRWLRSQFEKNTNQE